MIEVAITAPDGTERAIRSVRKLGDRTTQGLERTWFVVAKDLRAEFSRQVLDKRSKTGRIYIRRDRLGRGRKHQASAPGETPANRTGNYRRSIGTVISGNELRFGNTAEYAGFLELGTSRMRPRPGLNNAIRASERNILRDLADGIGESLPQE